jgi:hypothetical protein
MSFHSVGRIDIAARRCHSKPSAALIFFLTAFSLACILRLMVAVG